MTQFEKELHKFMSNLGFSTCHTSGDSCHWPPPEGSMLSPNDPNILRQDFQTLSGIPVDCSGLQDNNTNALQIDFDNKLTLHVCSGGYCHGRSGTKAKECKWGFGGKSEAQQHEGLKGLYGSKTCSTEFHLERDCRNRLHPCMPRNHPRRLCAAIQQWRLMGCNMDHQPFLCLDDPLCPTSDSTYVCTDYMCAYCCKHNPKPSVAVRVYEDTLDVIAEATPDRPRHTIVQTLMAKSIGERNIPHQQCVFENSGSSSWRSSFSFVKCGMSLSRGFKEHAATSEPGARTLSDNTVDKYVRTVQYLEGVEGFEKGNLKDTVKTQYFHDDTRPDSERIVAVNTISLYDFASTGTNQESPIGTFVPLPTGQTHIMKPSWPLRPDYCLLMLRLHEPAFIWKGALYPDQINGPDEDTVVQFQNFLKDEACPPFLCADVRRCESQHFSKDSSRSRGHSHHADSDDGEGGAAPQAPDSDSCDDDPQPSSYFEFLAGSGRVDADEDGPSNLKKPDFKILQLGNAVVVQYDKLVNGSVPVPLGCNMQSASTFWEQVTSEEKKSMTGRWSPVLTREDLLRANKEQRLIITGVLKTCQELLNGDKDVSPCHLIVAGTAGTGKSFVLKACTFLVQHLFGKAEAVRVAAATGSAAAQVGGTTIHSLLKLNPSAGSGGRESDSALLDLQAMCADLKMLQIDERSMLSPAMLGNIHQKLCRGYKKKDVAFGGIPFLILYGDDGQLPPPCATPLYDRAHAEKTQVERIGKLMYINIQKAVYLSQMVRQQKTACQACPTIGTNSHESGAMCEYFPNLLHRMRFSTTTSADWEWLKYRSLTEIERRDPADAERFRSSRSLWLVPTRAMAHNTNLERLENLHLQLLDSRGIGYAWVCPLSSTNNGKTAKTKFREQEDFGSLPSVTWICRDAPVIMTSNVCQKWNLYNGAVGQVVSIIFHSGEGPSEDGSTWPHMVLVNFPEYTGPEFFQDQPHLVPVFPVTFAEGGSSRTMFPIKLGFCVTGHKSQGFTCGLGCVYESVVVNLGPESVESWAPGYAFVTSSRPKRADDFAIHGDLTGSRVERITKGKVVDKVRLEDRRLQQMHVRTAIQFQNDNYEHLVDWALDHIANIAPCRPRVDSSNHNSGNPVVGEEDLANSHDPFDDDVDEVIQCDL